MAYAGDSRFSDKGDMANLTAAEKVTFLFLEYVAFGSEIVSVTRN